MKALIHVANVLFLLSYLVRDILWLRVVTLVAGALLVAYFAGQPGPPLEPLAWNAVFVGLNVAQLARLLRERRPVRLEGDEALLHRMAFRGVAPRDFRTLARLGAWRTAEEGEELVAAGRPLDRLLALYEGRVAIEARGERVADLCGGRLVGEMSFVTGEPPTARVVALARCRYLEWSSSELRRVTDADPALKAALQAAIGGDLAAKLRGA